MLNVFPITLPGFRKRGMRDFSAGAQSVLIEIGGVKLCFFCCQVFFNLVEDRALKTVAFRT